jgi:hypothetical protein
MGRKKKKVYRPKKENEIKLNSYLIKNNNELGIGIQKELVRKRK